MNQPLQLRINVYICQPNMGGGTLQISEEMQIPDTDFLGMAALMKRFHDLISEIREQQAKVKR